MRRTQAVQPNHEPGSRGGVPSCGTRQRVTPPKAGRTQCPNCKLRMTRSAAGRPTRLQCQSCGSQQTVSKPGSPKLKCMKCGASLTASMAVGSSTRGTATEPRGAPPRAARPKPPTRRQPNKTPPRPIADPSSVDLVCPRCDRSYVGQARARERCPTPGCREWLVPAATQPARKPWERESSAGGGPGTGKRR